MEKSPAVTMEFFLTLRFKHFGMIQLLSHRFFSFALVSYEINFGWLYFKLFLSLNTEQYLYQIQIYRKDVTLTGEVVG